MATEELSRFQSLLPLPQRCIVLVVGGLWLWYWQVSILVRVYHIDISQLVLSHDPAEFTPRPSASRLVESTHRAVAQVTKIIVPWHILTCVLLQQCNADQKYAPETWMVCFLNIQPVCQLITIFAVLFSNSPMLVRCFKKILCLGNIEPKPLRNNYILITDSLTSYGKPLIDFGLYFCHLMENPLNERCIVTRSSLGLSINLDLMIGISPVMLRLLQCLREWKRSNSSKEALNALFNAFKYSLSLPLLMCTVYSRAYPGEKPENLIYWFMLLSSLYGFWWDLTMDWNLGIFNFSSPGMERNELLRSRRIYPKFAYYVAMVVDFTLRFIWFWELTSGASVFEGEVNIFFLQALELVRRWVWIFFKLEAEATSAEGLEKAQE
ncbi:LAME_0D03752g1_1 [Lachancea meyersii CBS 8951]|uniref:LAME_0D03752g1_1 n=1 Tax=Lachancea meyersii CBS 8951 TaxID=1266667 RepID=A0A1G4J7R0_9SACH|nr:LAME_0D03752g1_1 [Lachancea meyersii CBS 8951]